MCVVSPLTWSIDFWTLSLCNPNYTPNAFKHQTTGV